MPKPICLIKLEREFAKRANLQSLKNALPGYNVLFVKATESQEEIFTIHVYWRRDYTDTQYEELKKIVQKSIKQD